MLKIEKKWYAIYTKPRWEKKVDKLLQAKDIETYLPLNKIKKKYTDRYKVVEEPLLKSYLFVKTTIKENYEVRLTDGVINFVYTEKKPAVVSEKDIITLKKFLKEYSNVFVKDIDFEIGQHIEVGTGLLMGRKGKITRVMNDTVIAKLHSIGVTILAKIDKKDIVLV